MRGQLISVWKALDEDGSGYLEAGEFGKFMRASQARAACPAGHATRAPAVNPIVPLIITPPSPRRSA